MAFYRLELGDALEKMKLLEPNSIDCIITDPPYPTISGGKGGDQSYSSAKRPAGMLSKNDGKIFSYNDIDIQSWIPECYRVLKNETHIYVMTNFLNLQHYMEVIEKAGFYIHNLLIWEKNNATPNRWYMKNCEYIIFARKGNAKPISDCGSKTVLHYDNIKHKIHPTEKPVELLKLFITNSTNENDIILDPFGGSFATALAAKMTKRSCISFEIDGNYYEKGKQRFDATECEEQIMTMKAKTITPIQKTILSVLETNPDKDYNGAELAKETGLSARSCSGCFTPLLTMKKIERVNDKSPMRVRLLRQRNI